MDQRSVRDILAGKTYFIRTFGCQMNQHDSERVSGLLDSYGCLMALDPEHADIVVFMTCCVREAADTRLYGQCNSCKSLPPSPSGKRVVAVGGCIAQRDGEGLLTNVDNVNVIFGTHSIAHVAELIAEAFLDGKRHIRTNEHEDTDAMSMPWHRETQYHAWVPIMTGCNNFCTYCIVPYVRGREKSRPFEEIVDEVTGLVRQGVREITLLGQNVNSYGRDLFGKPRFADLLRAVGDTGVERIFFTSSHPKDLLPETIDAMAETPAVMPQLHLAVQSGSTRILKEMNRRYTREDYLGLVDRIRNRMPDIALSTDIIVGFPRARPRKTLSRRSRLPRLCAMPKPTRLFTPSAPVPRQLRFMIPAPHEVILERFNRLVKVIETTAYEYNQGELHTVVPALIEGTSEKERRGPAGQESQESDRACAYAPRVTASISLLARSLMLTLTLPRPGTLSGSVVGEPR